jgi:hypothetical protein
LENLLGPARFGRGIPIWRKAQAKLEKRLSADPARRLAEETKALVAE